MFAALGIRLQGPRSRVRLAALSPAAALRALGREGARAGRDLGRCRRGVAALEFALAATPLIVVVFGFLAMNMIFYTLSVMQDSAQYAAMMVATGYTTSNTVGPFSASNTGTTDVVCTSSIVGTTAEHYACTGLPGWATFRVSTLENCATPSVTVTIKADASAAALADILQLFTGKTLSTTSVAMKQGKCP